MPSRTILTAIIAGLAVQHATQARAQSAPASAPAIATAPETAPADPLCAQLVAFAAATPAGAIRRVRFETDWGGAFDPDERVAYSLRCDHGDEPTGQALCAFLGAHASIEFPQRNFERALRCLGAQDERGDHDVAMTYRDAEALAMSLPGVDADTLVTIGFIAGSERAPPTLTIVADATRTDDDD